MVKNLKERYENFLARLKAKIDQDVASISSKDKEITDLAKGVAGKEVEAKVTQEAKDRIAELQNQIEVNKKELDALRTLYGKASD